MDLLSRALSGIRVSSPILAQINVANGASIDMLGGLGLPFHYVVSGDIEVELGGVRHPLNKVDLALFPHGDGHILHFNEGGPVQSIIDLVNERELPLWPIQQDLETPLYLDVGAPPFRASLLSGNTLLNTEETSFVTASLPPLIILHRQDTGIGSAIGAMWELVLGELLARPDGYAAVASRALEMLLVMALRSWLLRADHPPSWSNGIQHRHIRRALQVMYADPQRNWTVADLAEAAGQSRSAFAISFRETMDETPFAHLRRLRLHLAARRLHEGSKSISTIAAEVGYANNYALTRAFQKEMGITAASYRRKVRDKR